MPEVDEYQFTSSQDWFSHNVAVWGPLLTQLKASLPSDRTPRALEIGSWEGRSATYLLRTLCTEPSSLLVCVDHFDLMRTEAGKQRRARLEHNLTVASGGEPRYRVMEDFSVPALMRLLEDEIACTGGGGFDFVYVDGSHEADDTFLDAELAWRVTAQGGLFVFDDYGWETEDPASIHHPKRGIDAFLALHDGQYETVYRGYQVILRRTAAPRIGFLSKSVSSTANELGYGMNVVLCVNEAYAIGAAVAIRSAVACTPNRRITVYIVDCGLADASYERLQQACGSQMGERVTMIRISLPSHSRALEDPTWAKVDMCALLPVERVLYLDADVLVRKNLNELWSTSLQGCVLGAARDIGHPLGHAGLGDEKQPYFNAGVMLLDLARIRQRFSDLESFLSKREPTKFKDQDALNNFFADEWLELDLRWNATGLGTYAEWSAPDRDATWSHGELEKLHDDPAIVHFTGPVHPEMASVLNEYVQPWTSKPWGYGGAPGNPFTEAWWSILELTAWAGYRNSSERLIAMDDARADAMKAGCEAFKKAVESDSE